VDFGFDLVLETWCFAALCALSILTTPLGGLVTGDLVRPAAPGGAAKSSVVGFAAGRYFTV